MMTNEEKEQVKQEILDSIIPQIREAIQSEIDKQMVNMTANLTGNMSVTHKQPEPDQFTKLTSYINLLLTAQHVGHNVNREISNAFVDLRKLLGE